MTEFSLKLADFDTWFGLAILLFWIFIGLVGNFGSKAKKAKQKALQQKQARTRRQRQPNQVLEQAEHRAKTSERKSVRVGANMELTEEMIMDSLMLQQAREQSERVQTVAASENLPAPPSNEGPLKRLKKPQAQSHKRSRYELTKAHAKSAKVDILSGGLVNSIIAMEVLSKPKALRGQKRL